MDNRIRSHLENLRSEDRNLQNQAFNAVIEATGKPVDWAYDSVKDERVREQALTLIETEADLKYRKKYVSIWRVK